MNNNTNENFDEIPDADNQTHRQLTPPRHGCVTTWLIFMLVLNSFFTLIYFSQAFFSNHVSVIPFGVALLLTLIGVINTTCSIMLLRWKKIGFYIFAVTGFATLIININLGISPLKSLFGLAGGVILYAILQIKQDGISAWDNLK